MSFFFFFNDTATTEIYTLSLHDALPIFLGRPRAAPGRAGARQDADGPDGGRGARPPVFAHPVHARPDADRKSTRLNSSHLVISYAVFCLKKKKTRHGSRMHTAVHTCQYS